MVRQFSIDKYDVIFDVQQALRNASDPPSHDLTN